MKKKTKSWKFIIFFFFLFFPVGIYFLFQKLKYDQESFYKYTKPLKYTSYVLLLFGVVGIYQIFTGKPLSMDGLLITLCLWGSFLIGGVLILKSCLSVTRAQKGYYQYLDLVNDSNMTSFHQLAATLNVSEEIVRISLDDMIRKGYFTNARLDLLKQCIVLEETNNKEYEYDTPVEEEYIQKQPEQEVRTVICPGCGATHTVSAKHTCCEYCGTVLN